MSKIIKQTMYGYDYEIEVDEKDRPLLAHRIEKDGSKSFVCSYEYYGNIINNPRSRIVWCYNIPPMVMILKTNHVIKKYWKNIKHEEDKEVDWPWTPQ